MKRILAPIMFLALLAAVSARSERFRRQHAAMRRMLADNTTADDHAVEEPTQEQVDKLLGVYTPEASTQKMFSSELATLIMAKQFEKTGKVDSAKAFEEAQDLSKFAEYDPTMVSQQPKAPGSQVILYGADPKSGFWAGVVVLLDGDKVVKAHEIDGFMYMTGISGHPDKHVAIEGADALGDVHVFGQLMDDGHLVLSVDNRIREGESDGSHADVSYLETGVYVKGSETADEALTAAAIKAEDDFAGVVENMPGDSSSSSSSSDASSDASSSSTSDSDTSSSGN